MRDYTPYQKHVIRNYYENRPHIMLQKLSEIVSELFLAESETKQRRLWAAAEKALRNLKVPSARIAHILESQDVHLLAEVIKDFF
jgi:hypothetical protein